jgi:hypothetical protein
MTIYKIDLPPDVEAALTKRAEAGGLALNQYAQVLAEDHLRKLVTASADPREASKAGVIFQIRLESSDDRNEDQPERSRHGALS